MRAAAPLLCNPGLRPVAVGLALAALAGAGAGRAAEPARVLKVLDGDTVRVALPDGSERLVRLIGVDAPEVAGPHRHPELGGGAATAALRRLLPPGPVGLERDATAGDEDRYGRLLRYLRLEDGRDAGAELIAAGFAEAYRRFPHARRDSYRALEEEARRAGRGLWGEGCAAAGGAAGPGG